MVFLITAQQVTHKIFFVDTNCLDKGKVESRPIRAHLFTWVFFM